MIGVEAEMIDELAASTSLFLSQVYKSPFNLFNSLCCSYLIYISVIVLYSCIEKTAAFTAANVAVYCDLQSTNKGAAS